MSDEDSLPVTGVFVGGPNDGQHMRLPSPNARVRIVIPSSDLFFSLQTSDPRMHDYILYRCVRTPETLVALYTLEEMDDDTLLLALLSRYVAPEHGLQALQPHPTQPWK